jgi:hypothetical protein
VSGEGEGAAELVRTLDRLHHDLVVTMQAAWIEWRNGRGAEVAMQWIENTLDGPGLIPDPDAPYYDDAQKFHSLNKSDPWPACEVCGDPSCHMWAGKGFCSQTHLDQYRAGRLPDEQEQP